MKFFKRYLSVLCVAVSLFLVFSLNVSAEATTDSREYKFYRQIDGTNSWSLKTYKQMIYTTSAGVGIIDEFSTVNNYGIPPNQTWYKCNDILTISDATDGNVLVEKGEETTFSVYNYYTQFGVNDSRGFFYSRNHTLENILINYMDGTSEYISDLSSAQLIINDSLIDISFTFKPKKHVKSIEIHTQNRATIEAIAQQTQITFYGGMPEKLTTVNIQQSSEESGLLKGIIEWLKGIKDGITNLFNSISSGFTNVVNGISNIFNSITELPSKIWNLISEGLKSLFVPDEQYMVDYSDSWDNLLSSRFGAIYQVGTIITDFAERIEVSDKTNTINIPAVSLNSVGIPFTFGGYDVQIVPSGFDFIVETLKIIVSIVCTFMFVNGLRKRYDEVMGVEQ